MHTSEWTPLLAIANKSKDRILSRGEAIRRFIALAFNGNRNAMLAWKGRQHKRHGQWQVMARHDGSVQLLNENNSMIVRVFRPKLDSTNKAVDPTPVYERNRAHMAKYGNSKYGSAGDGKIADYRDDRSNEYYAMRNA